MKTFDFTKGLLFGVLLWAVGAGALWVLSLTALSAGWIHGIVAAVIGVTAYLLSLAEKPEGATQALGYGVMFVAIGMAFDALFVRALDAHVFSSWQYYAGYVLALFAPFVELEVDKTTPVSI